MANSEEILIVGGTGFSGRALAPVLATNFAAVHLLGRQKKAAFPADNIHYYCATLNDTRTLRSVLSRCKTVVYLASDTTPGTSAQLPSMELNANLLPMITF